MRVILSDSEKAVARCLLSSAGLNADIAKVRGVSVDTVSKQVQGLFNKLGADNRVALVVRLLTRPEILAEVFH
jgi:DNA-binding NarL/FixJ family response regulator